MCESSKKTKYAVAGSARLTTANSALNGSGAIQTVITGAGDGTTIYSITIKAQQSTTLGMVRLFIYNGSVSYLFREISIPQINQNATTSTFFYRFSFGFDLQTGYEIRATTERGEKFTVVADGEYYVNCNCI